MPAEPTAPETRTSRSVPVPRLHALVDARLLAYQQGGISTYIRGLVEGFAAYADHFDLTMILSRKQRDLPWRPQWTRSAHAWTPCHHRLERFTFGLEVGRLRADLLHCPDFIAPLRPLGPRRAIVTVHDLAFIRFPDHLTTDSLRYYGQIARAVAEADAVIAVSECTRRDLHQLVGADVRKVVVIPEAARPSFRPVPDSPDRRFTLAKFGIDRAYLIFVGTIEPRKNLPVLLRAYHALRARLGDRVPLLVVAGRPGWLFDDVFATVERLRLGSDVRFLGPVDEAQLPSLMSAALALVYPSLYEGFGLPVLEAMACGTPVVASNVAAIAEVAGDAAVLVSPDDQDGWTEQLARLVDDAGLRRELSARGVARAQQFSWQRAAAQTLRLYHDVVGLPTPVALDPALAK